ncbi:hypothetical protein [Cellulomonas marina]|uniref:Tight adherence protein B n=1 Tax=Cellulomonas marina TaxID=988821 RepID=A0A1I0XGK2_9CELL|nr:hypothetical protein [Cellulomonas marina]GIG29840.1 hypothetical protein Cma02nite_24400 [Cellulomonas marina]SFB00101.1 tight adherence protein B [Cellulomonas marina]
MSTGAAAAAVLSVVALVLLLLGGPASSRTPAVTARPSAAVTGDDRDEEARPGARGGRRRREGLTPRGATRRPAPPLDAVLLDVAARLRAGVAPAAAWSAVLGTAAGPVGADGVPSVGQLGAAGTRRPSLRSLVRRDAEAPLGDATPGAVEAAVVVAAARLAGTLGAPLAPVLEHVADAVAAQADVDGERRAAVAGPRASAALLGRLPLLGAGVGLALGADPLAAATDGGPGTAAVVLGVVLLVVGRRWSAALLARAEQAGRAP